MIFNDNNNINTILISNNDNINNNENIIIMWKQ